MKVLQNHIVGTNFSLQSASITLFIYTGQLQSSCHVHHLPFFRHLRPAAADFYRYGGEAEGVGRYGQTGDDGTAVERTVEVEDEIAEAVEDGAAAVDFNVLGRVGVVADDGVGTGVNEAVGVGALGERGVERVLRAPMEADENTGRGTAAAQGGDCVAQDADGRLAHTRPGGHRDIVFGHDEQRREHVDGARRRRYQLRTGGRGRVFAISEGRHSGVDDVAVGVGQAAAALIDAVVVGQIEVGHAVAPQDGQHVGTGAEDETLVQGTLDVGRGTLQIGHHGISRGEEGVYRGCEQGVGAAVSYHPVHVAAEHDVAREEDVEGVTVGGKHRRRTRRKKRHYYKDELRLHHVSE